MEGKLIGRDYYRYAVIGRPPGPGQEGKPIATTWSQYIVQFDDLPLDGLSQMRVRVDLMGAGEVWADDVQLFDLAFNETELRALYKLLTLADLNLQNGQVGDCMKLLDGYWPRFLMQNVPLPPAVPALASKPAAGAAFRRQAGRGAAVKLDRSREGDLAGAAVVRQIIPGARVQAIPFRRWAATGELKNRVRAEFPVEPTRRLTARRILRHVGCRTSAHVHAEFATRPPVMRVFSLPNCGNSCQSGVNPPKGRAESVCIFCNIGVACPGLPQMGEFKNSADGRTAFIPCVPVIGRLSEVDVGPAEGSGGVGQSRRTRRRGCRHCVAACSVADPTAETERQRQIAKGLGLESAYHSDGRPRVARQDYEVIDAE